MKQVIVVRRDLGMRQGKACAQSCHASMKAILDSAYKTTIGPDEMSGVPECTAFAFQKDSYVASWLLGSFTKIVCRIESEKELLALYRDVKDYNLKNLKTEVPYLPVSLVTDIGLTEFCGTPTNTCIAIGPGPIALVDKFTKHLQLL